MPYIKRFCISGSAFWGWHTDIDLDDMDNMEDIIQIVKQRLKAWVDVAARATQQDDMHGLYKAIEDLTLNCHGVTFGDILVSDPETIFYLCHCDHDHSFSSDADLDTHTD